MSPDQPPLVAYSAPNGIIQADYKWFGQGWVPIEEVLFIFLYAFTYLSLSVSVYYIFGINPLLWVGP
jgi:hypothetical protein